ncbi:MAG: cation-translocating P-type ATPase [Burkholderiales bacterium]|nr:cation-translocating P-type ATPase [Burkholderiales bacterium]
MHPDFALHPASLGPLIDDPAEQAGFTSWQQDAAGQRIAESHFALTGLYCAACADVIEHALRAEPGVVSASVNYATRRASVRWRTERTRPSVLVAAVARAGYAAAPDLAEPARALRQRAWRDALWRLFVAAFCMMQVMMYAAPAYVAAPGTLAPDLLRLLQWASWLLSLPVVLFSAAPIFREAWQGVLQRQVRMDLPVAIGIGVTFAASSVATFAPDTGLGHEVYFDSLTMFVFFLLGGRTLALRAQGRVAASLEAALARQPQAVRRLEADGSVTLVALRALGIGDRVRVLVGEAFPADGCVTEGQTRVDEALLTGESRPVPKQPGDAAIAGSLNLGAPVTLRVERLGADTRYEAVVALMRSALTQRPALVRAADRVAVPFLWGVLLLAAAAGGVWSFIDPARAVWVMVSVLIVTCPCALSLAAPSALLAAAGSLARRGVLVQRLDALEALANLQTLYFDKTGTLTEDRLELRAVHVLPAALQAGLDAPAVLAQAGALAAFSAHPLSRALADHARQAQASVAPPWSGVTEQAGAGLQAFAPGAGATRLGAREWVDASHPALPGITGAQVWFGDERGALGCFEFDEALRPDAAALLAGLREAGLGLALLSGDTPERVQRVAGRLGVADAQGAATPELKLARLAAAQRAGLRVGMVGDGLNDAPVMARAHVSFAMGEGAAITRSKADFILMSGRLADVLFARVTARRAMRVVRQNLGWALAYNLTCVPLALFGLFPPWAAGLGMAASSLAVVLNAMRIAR